jgi:predicted dehydrogenase
VKFLIAGLGSIGRRHLQNLQALGQTDFVLYRTGKGTLPDENLAGIPVETNLEAALDHQPDAVIISNPTALHLEVALPAAQRGMAIFLEKPLSHNMEGIKELSQVVSQNQIKVLVGFQFRFHPGLRRVSVLLEQGAIGRPLSARAHWGEYLPAWHPWEDYRKGYSARSDLGGGVVLTLCHPLDYLHMLLGKVQELWAFTGANSDLLIPVEDTAEIGLKFANGVVGTVHLDYIQRPPSHWLEITGNQGTIRWDYADGAVHLYTAQTEQWQEFSAPTGYERNHMFLEQMRHFLAMLTRDFPPVCSLEDGIHALEVALGALESARTGRLVVI